MKKKILFLQVKGNSLGGVWFVNKTLGEYFLKNGYDVEVVGIRNNHPGMVINDTTLKITTINKKDKWEITHRKDVLLKLFKKGFIKTVKKYFSDKKKRLNDFETTKEKIKKINPDYIIASQYELLNCIPDEYLKKTISIQHITFDQFLNNRTGIKTLKKFDNKIFTNCWLSKSSMESANKSSLTNNCYIYNPNKFTTHKISDVTKNKKIVVISRIHSEKRIDLMIEIVNDVFEELNLKDWTFEIYGTGSFNEKSKEILNTSSQIFYKGLTNNPEDILLNASLTLNTSLYEGFPLSIIEAYTCGLPVISFDYGESAKEAIVDGETGFLIKQDDINEYKNKLKLLLTEKELLLDFSHNAKKYSELFSIEIIAKEWEKLFNEIDNKN